MIETRAQLKACIQEDRKAYIQPGDLKEMVLMGEVKLKIYKFVKLLRYTEYHKNQNGIFHKLLYVYYRRRKNRLGIKLGIEMTYNCFDSGLTIYHAGNIVVNGDVRVGKNCRLHGSNCIGNDGKSYACPQIGNNVRLGVGAKVIGDVKIADNIIIAAGAVVVDSFSEPGITIAGVPARRVK